MRKVTLNVTSKIVLTLNDDAVIYDALIELFDDMSSINNAYDVADAELLEYEIVDSK